MSKKKTSSRAAAKAASDSVRANNVKPTAGSANYHHDTKPVHETLQQGRMYNTSKGIGTYKGRSWSNGKLLFIGLDKKNIYFTLAEWREGNNDPKNFNDEVAQEIATAAKVIKKEKETTSMRGFVIGRTQVHDIETDQYAMFEGVHDMYGLKLRYTHGARAVVYFTVSQFNKRFDIVDYNISDEEFKALDDGLKLLRKNSPKI